VAQYQDDAGGRRRGAPDAAGSGAPEASREPSVDALADTRDSGESPGVSDASAAFADARASAESPGVSDPNAALADTRARPAASVPAPPPRPDRPRGDAAPRRAPSSTPPRATAPPDDDHVPLGSQVGRFVIYKVLGAGGMGVVYEASDPDLDRRVALKLLRGGRGRNELSDRLLREAQALAQLSHPHVVTVYEVGVHADEIFLAMEYLDGGTLDQRMERGPIPWREAIELFLQAGRGLEAAHR